MVPRHKTKMFSELATKTAAIRIRKLNILNLLVTSTRFVSQFKHGLDLSQAKRHNNNYARVASGLSDKFKLIDL